MSQSSLKISSHCCYFDQTSLTLSNISANICEYSQILPSLYEFLPASFSNLNFYRKYKSSFDPEWVNCSIDF
jgi:hypothetical protein